MDAVSLLFFSVKVLDGILAVSSDTSSSFDNNDAAAAAFAFNWGAVVGASVGELIGTFLVLCIGTFIIGTFVGAEGHLTALRVFGFSTTQFRGFERI